MSQPERIGVILGRVMVEIEHHRRYIRKGKQLELPFEEGKEVPGGYISALRRPDLQNEERL